MARTSVRDDLKRFNWWRTIAIAFAIALHAGIITLLLAPTAPPQATQKAKQRIVQVNFIPPPPPPPPPPPAVVMVTVTVFRAEPPAESLVHTVAV